MLVMTVLVARPPLMTLRMEGCVTRHGHVRRREHVQCLLLRQLRRARVGASVLRLRRRLRS